MSSAPLEKEFCIQKLNAVLALINKLLESEFPHPDTKAALDTLQTVFSTELNRLTSLSDKLSLDTTLGYCLDANVRIVKLQLFLGMLIRSSNLRNAFEMFFPIKILARQMLTPDHAKLILSSEWHFSPFTYPVSPEELPGFIFIGFPASESQNALLIPLAAHELGHVIWRRKGRGVKADFDPAIRDCILDLYRNNWTRIKTDCFDGREIDKSKLETDLFTIGTWGQSATLAQRQLEEIFCDFIGVFIFGPSFLHAFRYLVAPSLGKSRSVKYPSLRARAKYMKFAAEHYGIPTSDNFVDGFQEQLTRLPKRSTAIVEMADSATEQLYPKLIELVDKHHGEAKPYTTYMTEVKNTRVSLENLIPAANTDSIAVIVNAGWEIRLALEKWDLSLREKDKQKIEVEKMRILNDLLLKSFEVYEFRKRLKRHAT